MTNEELIRVIRHNEQLKADVARLKRQVKYLRRKEMRGGRAGEGEHI